MTLQHLCRQGLDGLVAEGFPAPARQDGAQDSGTFRRDGELVGSARGKRVQFVEDPIPRVLGEDRCRPGTAGLAADDQFIGADGDAHAVEDGGEALRPEEPGRELAAEFLVALGHDRRPLVAHRRLVGHDPLPQPRHSQLVVIHGRRFPWAETLLGRNGPEAAADWVMRAS